MILSALYIEIFIGLLLAIFFGAVLGVERNLAGKMAGMRTYSLVSLGSALFISISRLVLVSLQTSTLNVDPLRLASQVVVGIGFIGAGLVVFRGSELTGITTAAGVWVSAGVGMACGFGLYALALFATGLTLFIFTIMWTIERDYIKARLVDNLCVSSGSKKTKEEDSDSVYDQQ